jgi:hypothetical protein
MQEPNQETSALSATATDATCLTATPQVDPLRKFGTSILRNSVSVLQILQPTGAGKPKAARCGLAGAGEPQCSRASLTELKLLCYDDTLMNVSGQQCLMATASWISEMDVNAPQ